MLGPGAAVNPRVAAGLRVLAGVAVLALLASHVGTDAVLHALRAVDPATLLAAVALGAATIVCGAWRWCLVARDLGMRLSLRGAVADCYQALLLNSVLPAGVLGDVHRAIGHGRREGDVGAGVRAVVLERLAGHVVLVVVVLVVLVAQPGLVGLLPVPGWAVAATAVAVGWLLRARLRGVLAGASAVLRPDVLALSAVALAGCLATFVLAARAAGVTAPLGTLLPLLVVALCAMALPLNVGGWGPREAAAAAAFGAAGLGAAQGLATAVVYGVLGLVSVLPGAVVLLVRGTRRRSGPGSPALLVLSPPSPATGVPPLPTPCTPASPGSAGAAGRRPARPGTAV